jgi:Fe2+ or Zn2+ uptake regulation protein
MEPQVHFICFSKDQAKEFLVDIIMECLSKISKKDGHSLEPELTISQACKKLGISVPTLRKYVRAGLVRRHNRGPRKKVFFLNELQEDIRTALDKNFQ